MSIFPNFSDSFAYTASNCGSSSVTDFPAILAFSILINDPVPGKNNQGGYRLLENRICEFLAKSDV